MCRLFNFQRFPILHRCRVSWFAYGLAIALSTIALSLHSSDSTAIEATETLLQQSRQRYDAGQLNEAKDLLSKVRQQSQASGNRLIGAIALSNLALIESDQGNWKTANQAIADSLQSVRSSSDGSKNPLVLAQILNVQGRLHRETRSQHYKPGNNPPNSIAKMEIATVRFKVNCGRHKRSKL